MGNISKSGRLRGKPAARKPPATPARAPKSSAKKTPAPVKGQHGGPRANSGGARPGAGRPRAALPPDSLERLGPPPVDSPLEMARWWSKLLGECGWLMATGQVGGELAHNLKSLAATAGRLVPEDLRAEVDKQIRALDAASKPEAQGPKLEDHRGEQPPLRGVPR